MGGPSACSIAKTIWAWAKQPAHSARMHPRPAPQRPGAPTRNTAWRAKGAHHRAGRAPAFTSVTNCLICAVPTTGAGNELPDQADEWVQVMFDAAHQHKTRPTHHPTGKLEGRVLHETFRIDSACAAPQGNFIYPA
jgi:hypothetical protein